MMTEVVDGTIGMPAAADSSHLSPVMTAILGMAESGDAD
jgi:hypothetical protein